MRLVKFIILLFLVQCWAETPKNEEDTDDSKTVGGEDADDGQFPYQISLQESEQHICGGSIISNQFILTAACCVQGKSPEKLSVVAGTNSLDGTGRRLKIKTVIPHPRYNSTSTANDIALLKLSETIEFNERMKAIGLPKMDTPAGKALTSTGWGKTSFPGPVSQTLKRIKATSMSNSDCRKSYYNVTSGNICTKDIFNRGVCPGDSGGPLADGEIQVGGSQILYLAKKDDQMFSLDYIPLETG